MNKCLGSWYDNHNQHHTCDHPTRDLYLCRNCTTHLERRIGNLPALNNELTLTLTRQSRLSDQSGHGTDTPLVVNLAAANVGADLHRTLDRIARHIAYHHEPLPAERTGPRCLWLITRFQRIPPDPEAGNIVDAINDITKRLLNVIDLPEDKRTFPVGLCPELTDQGTQCPGEIRAHIPVEDGKLARMECTTCGVVYETWQWLRAGRRIRPMSPRNLSAPPEKIGA